MAGHALYMLPKKGLSPYAETAAACVLWMCVSSILIVLNKRLMSSGFSYPMCLSGLGMLFSSVGSFMACRVFSVIELKTPTKDGHSIVNTKFYLTRIMPVGLLMALTLYFGNLVYLYLNVAFIQMLKSLTPVMTMIFMFLAKIESPTRPLILSVAVIAIGTGIASYGEVNFSVVGVLFMLLSGACESLRLVMTQLILEGFNFHPIEGLMYFAPACTFWLGIGTIVLELEPMMSDGAFNLIARKRLEFFFAAGMGFAVNWGSYLVIILSSSLTLKVLGTMKNVVVILLGVLLFSDQVSLLELVGYGLGLSGFAWYSWIKMQTTKTARKKAGSVEEPLKLRDIED